MDEYLKKPVRMAELLGGLQDHIGDTAGGNVTS
ncbi:MAG: hypothetical protein ACI89X_003338 [Planctomycetota bacterium]|jgi:hypothetical protein